MILAAGAVALPLLTWRLATDSFPACLTGRRWVARPSRWPWNTSPHWRARPSGHPVASLWRRLPLPIPPVRPMRIMVDEVLMRMRLLPENSLVG